MKDVLTLLLAGGKGTRLEPLTRERAKPAVPFGGLYRIIDFTLSNCINSGLRRILVLTQYKARSLDRHLAAGWGFLHRELDEYIEVLPPQQRIDEHWYQGTADAIYQNIYSIEKSDARLMLILAGDHIYTMDYSAMIRRHIETKADLTIGCIKVPRLEGIHFGVMDVDTEDRVVGFLEKPPDPPGLPSDPDQCLASMGIYVFTARVMYDLLFKDAAVENSRHDFGTDVIPNILNTHQVRAYSLRNPLDDQETYWRDVGTLDAYYQANMDLIAVSPIFNLYDKNWPIRTNQPQLPPPKFVFNDEGPRENSRRGEAHQSIVCQGCIISGGHVRNSILSPNVRVNSYAIVDDSILFDGVDIGRHSKIRRAIIDKQVKVPPHTTIGYDLEDDRRKGFHITDSGIVVIPKAETADSYIDRLRS